MIRAYKLPYWLAYDPESVWALVQRHGGFLSILSGAEYIFWIPELWESVLLLAFPLLVRSAEMDYISWPVVLKYTIILLVNNLLTYTTYNADHVSHYGEFHRVCRVNEDPVTAHWYYTEINSAIMYSTHRSWVYFLTVNGAIVKIGESGNPLGIVTRTQDYAEAQPLKATTNRLGRYRAGDQSDQRVREQIHEYLTCNPGAVVEFWARACPVDHTEMLVGTGMITVENQHHKQLEKALLDYYREHVGRYPLYNTGRC